MSYILVAEDDTDSRQLIVDLLRAVGYELRSAENGSLALDLAMGERPALLLLDVAMPGMTGLDVTRQVRERYGSDGPPIFLLSAYGLRSDVEDGLLAGATDYLVKPFEPLELLEKVRTVMRHADATQPHRPRSLP